MKSHWLHLALGLALLSTIDSTDAWSKGHSSHASSGAHAAHVGHAAVRSSSGGSAHRGREEASSGSLKLNKLPPSTAGVELAVHHMGVVNFMKAMAQKKTLKLEADGKQYTASPKALDAFWQNKKNSMWLENRFRDARPNDHEFIPSDQMLNVVHRSNSKGTKWVDLQDQMRIATSDVIFKQDKTNITETIHGKKYAKLQGHSGATYEKRLYHGKVQEVPDTVKQPEFHNELRQAYKSSKTPAEEVKKVKSIVKNWVWDGKAVGMPLSPHVTRRDGSSIKPAEQAKAYKRIMTMLDHVGKEVGGAK
jgi:hypothetical protein